jgi:transcriptional regulator with XRE-family HTH domain
MDVLLINVPDMSASTETAIEKNRIRRHFQTDHIMNQKRKRPTTNLFSKRLRRLMEEKKITIREASKLTGVASSTLDDWRSGAMPEDYVAVKRLGQVLGVSLSFLLTGEDDTRPEGIMPSIAEVFDDGGPLFDGYARIVIHRLLPKGEKKE